jgi:tetratricopeptide (TPR) repeat protein
VKLVPVTALAVALAAAAPVRAQSSSDELVRQARAHEAAHEDDVAARRYVDALRLDPTNGDAYLGLGALRLRTNDLREAERVYSVALEHVPSLRKALAGRARVRWKLGLHDAATNEMESYLVYETSTPELRELGDWYGEDGRTPAQLSVWRRILVVASDAGDATLAREARIKVRALQILVGPADPVAAPIEPSAARRMIATVAKRGGP